MGNGIRHKVTVQVLPQTHAYGKSASSDELLFDYIARSQHRIARIVAERTHAHVFANIHAGVCRAPLNAQAFHYIAGPARRDTQGVRGGACTPAPACRCGITIDCRYLLAGAFFGYGAAHFKE